ncbi:ionotropic receptor 75a-like [Plodia interpunctella]|uniref:ionotropic receptor 75a-like n=1 Tax=Plodia interpunctella TaxID=58824 RepID=UPI002368106A|nr:ionotropic receptor 75a-like [Plodia interpunctella]XP_053602459.1 ionotropic receptor 75a-like [Plodia interpunctella]XP_053602460.1 ionotropic receptor 75a-like [Plodia interpunctella]
MRFLLALIPMVVSQRFAVDLATNYFTLRGVKYVCYLSCDDHYQNALIAKNLFHHNIRTTLSTVDNALKNLPALLHRENVPVGVLLGGECDGALDVLEDASRQTLLDASRYWLILHTTSTEFQNFQSLNLSVDADIIVASCNGGQCQLTDLFNFGKIQGNSLETSDAGIWNSTEGRNLALNAYKYYRRWDFHNLTLRAVSVILNSSVEFNPAMLTDVRYTAGVSAMTKIVAQLLGILMEQHNFRFNYTIASRWIGTPERNSTLAVTNSLLWREQDISCTCARIFPQWLDWVDIFYPPATTLETKFYYLIPSKGVGDYENRFLTPMSPGVWWTSAFAGLVCMIVLAVAASMENRKDPGLFALFSVLAAMCQQAYEDVQQLEERFSSQGRRVTLLVVGLLSMLLYNYYTSSVVSWLLNAAAPTIDTMDGLIRSDLELVFEDIGYTKGWLDNPGFFYYSGYKNPKEDELRDKKVIRAQRTVPILQSVVDGIELVRKGDYAYHTEPYTASQVISRTFADRELCDLSSLQIMSPAFVYIMAQKNSPYKEFFVWSLLRLAERGHRSASQRRINVVIPSCSGRTPRALALGQAAPAFLLLIQAALLSLFILVLEIIWHRIEMKKKQKL